MYSFSREPYGKNRSAPTKETNGEEDRAAASWSVLQPPQLV
mgnify:CR=1 FL=1